MKFVDYAFYRIYSFYKSKKDDHPRLYAIGILSLFFYLGSLHLMAVFEITSSYRMRMEHAYVPMIVIFSLIIAMYHNKDVSLLEQRFSSETAQQRFRRGTIIVSSIVLCFGLVLFDRIIINALK